jgi:hypothetical protein
MYRQRKDQHLDDAERKVKPVCIWRYPVKISSLNTVADNASEPDWHRLEKMQRHRQ